MSNKYGPKFYVVLHKPNGEQSLLLNAEGTEPGRFYETSAKRLAQAMIDRHLAESYELKQVEDKAKD